MPYKVQLPPAILYVMVLVVLLLGWASVNVADAWLSQRNSIDGVWSYRLVVDSVELSHPNHNVVGDVVTGTISLHLANRTAAWWLTTYRGNYCGDLASLVHRIGMDFDPKTDFATAERTERAASASSSRLRSVKPTSTMA